MKVSRCVASRLQPPIIRPRVDRRLIAASKSTRGSIYSSTYDEVRQVLDTLGTVMSVVPVAFRWPELFETQPCCWARVA